MLIVLNGTERTYRIDRGDREENIFMVFGGSKFKAQSVPFINGTCPKPSSER
jgi:hypothetical protein